MIIDKFTMPYIFILFYISNPFSANLFCIIYGIITFTFNP